MSVVSRKLAEQPDSWILFEQEVSGFRCLDFSIISLPKRIAPVQVMALGCHSGTSPLYRLGFEPVWMSPKLMRPITSAGSASIDLIFF